MKCILIVTSLLPLLLCRLTLLWLWLALSLWFSAFSKWNPSGARGNLLTARLLWWSDIFFSQLTFLIPRRETLNAREAKSNGVILQSFGVSFTL